MVWNFECDMCLYATGSLADIELTKISTMRTDWKVDFYNLEDIEFQNLFSLAKSDKTRNAEGKIYVEHCNTVKTIHLIYELHATGTYPRHC